MSKYPKYHEKMVKFTIGSNFRFLDIAKAFDNILYIYSNYLCQALVITITTAGDLYIDISMTLKGKCKQSKNTNNHKKIREQTVY